MTLRLTYDDLDRLRVGLLRRLLSGQIDVATYCTEWDRLVEFSGWTWDEVLAEIDRRWSVASSVVVPLYVC